MEVIPGQRKTPSGGEVGSGAEASIPVKGHEVHDHGKAKVARLTGQMQPQSEGPCARNQDEHLTPWMAAMPRDREGKWRLDGLGCTVMPKRQTANGAGGN